MGNEFLDDLDDRTEGSDNEFIDAMPVEASSRGFLDVAMGIPDAAATIGAGVVSEVAGGIFGGIEAARSGPAAGTKMIETAREGSYQPKTQTGEDIMGGLTWMLEQIQSGVNKLAGGAGYVVESRSGGSPEQAAQVYSDIQEQSIGPYMGEKTLEATGSPLAATLVDTIPEATVLLAGGRTLPKAKLPGKAKAPKPGAPRTAEVILKDIKAGKMTVADDVAASPQLLKDAKALGVELDASHVSTNQVFIELEQALKGKPGSELSKIEVQAMERLGAEADALVRATGGTVDQAALNAQVAGDFERQIAKIKGKEDTLFDGPGGINATVDQSMRVYIDASEKYIAGRLKKFGGNVDRLTKAEKDLLKVIKLKNKLYKTKANPKGAPRTGNRPTYGAIDELRKDIGRGFKNQGRYGDDNSHTLGKVYDAILKDQRGIVEDVYGLGSMFDDVRALTVKRKDLQDRSQAIHGKMVDSSITPKLKNAANSLIKNGDPLPMNKLFAAVPKASREATVGTFLDHLFRFGKRSGSGDSISQGFRAAYESLTRNPRAKRALFKHLPTEARIRFDMLGRVTSSLYRAKAFEGASRSGGVASVLVKGMDDLTIIGKIYQGTIKVATKVIPTQVAKDTIFSWLTSSTKASKTADTFLASNAFKQAMETAAGGNTQAANAIVSRSPAYKAWKANLNKEQLAKLTDAGFIDWLTTQD